MKLNMFKFLLAAMTVCSTNAWTAEEEVRFASRRKKCKNELYQETMHRQHIIIKLSCLWRSRELSPAGARVTFTPVAVVLPCSAKLFLSLKFCCTTPSGQESG